jgi:hypothetical protein
MSKKTENPEDKKKSIKVRDSLKDFDISINSFGEINTNYDVDKINQFLNQNVADKKLKNRQEEDKQTEDDTNTNES